MSALHRENPEASPEEIESKQRAALLFGGGEPEGPVVERSCRDCGNVFRQSAKFVGNNGKFASLCAYCLAGEI